MPRLGRDTRVELPQFLHARVRGSNGKRTTSVLRASSGLEHDTDLEQCEVREPTRQVSAGNLDHPGDERRSEVGGLGVERICELDGRRLSTRSNAEYIDLRSRFERVGDDFGRPARG